MKFGFINYLNRVHAAEQFKTTNGIIYWIFNICNLIPRAFVLFCNVKIFKWTQIIAQTRSGTQRQQAPHSWGKSSIRKLYDLWVQKQKSWTQLFIQIVKRFVKFCVDFSGKIKSVEKPPNWIGEYNEWKTDKTFVILLHIKFNHLILDYLVHMVPLSTQWMPSIEWAIWNANAYELGTVYSVYCAQWGQRHMSAPIKARRRETTIALVSKTK